MRIHIFRGLIWIRIVCNPMMNGLQNKLLASKKIINYKASDKVHKSNFNRLHLTYFSSPNPMFDNKWSNIGFGEEISIIKIKITSYLELCNYLSKHLYLFVDVQ